MPVEAKAAILNVTVTAPKANGVLTLFPDGWPVPTASNLNFVTGQTIPNLVVVPLVAGKAMIRNASPGTTHVVVDVAGYFAAPSYGVADQTYVPYGPSGSRTAATRPAGCGPYGPSAPREKAAVAPLVEEDSFCGSDCPEPTAAVVNLTVTAPTAGGVLTVVPGRSDAADGVQRQLRGAGDGVQPGRGQGRRGRADRRVPQQQRFHSRHRRSVGVLHRRPLTSPASAAAASPFRGRGPTAERPTRTERSGAARFGGRRIRLLDSGLLATMSSGATVTNNTIVTDCRVGIDLYSDSSGASVRNNTVRRDQRDVAGSGIFRFSGPGWVGFWWTRIAAPSRVEGGRPERGGVP